MKTLKLSHISAGFIAVLVGYTSSVAIIFQAAQSLNASQAQLNSWMLALGLGMGISSIFLSLRYKMPIITAWSTPGAALLVTSLEGVSMELAIGSFIMCGMLILLFAVTRWFNKIQQLIPSSIANAMLAGILFQFGLNIFLSMEQNLLLAALMAASFILIKPLFKNFTIPTVLLLGLGLSYHQGLFNTQSLAIHFALPVWVSPQFSLAAFISVTIPLFFVTMTSQNIPGAATLKAAGYQAPISAALSTTGLLTVVLAPFGGFSYNLAAITAAICSSPEADTNRETRYLAGVFTGIFYLIIGLFGATVVSLFLIIPQTLIMVIAGLALLTTLGNSLSGALESTTEREAALITFLVTISGIEFYAIGSAFWGLVIGMSCVAISSFYRSQKRAL